jgi:Uma2 family endonuclease
MLTERFNPIIQPERFKFSFEMFEALSENGHFGDKKVELLNGEILVKGLQSDDHAYAIQHLTDVFYAHLVEQAVIRVQLPLVLESPPPDFVLPDVALLKLPKLQYKTRTANSNDALLVVEMSNSTLDYDQTTKLEAYARNQIPEYWIYHVNTNQLEVCTQPDGQTYTLRVILKVGQTAPILGSSLSWWY